MPICTMNCAALNNGGNVAAYELRTAYSCKSCVRESAHFAKRTDEDCSYFPQRCTANACHLGVSSALKCGMVRKKIAASSHVNGSNMLASANRASTAALLESTPMHSRYMPKNLIIEGSEKFSAVRKSFRKSNPRS